MLMTDSTCELTDGFYILYKKDSTFPKSSTKYSLKEQVACEDGSVTYIATIENVTSPEECKGYCDSARKCAQFFYGGHMCQFMDAKGCKLRDGFFQLYKKPATPSTASANGPMSIFSILAAAVAMVMV